MGQPAGRLMSWVLAGVGSRLALIPPTRVEIARGVQLRVMQRGRLVLQGVRRRAAGRLGPTLALGRVALGLGGGAGRLIAGFCQGLDRVLQRGLVEYLG